MCKVTGINDLELARKAERRTASIKRGQMISLRRAIETHKQQAEIYTEVGNKSDNKADKFIANGFAQEELKKAAELQRQLDEMK
jgi:hypothetical protein